MRISSRLFTQYHVMDFFLHIKKYKHKKTQAKIRLKAQQLVTILSPQL